MFGIRKAKPAGQSVVFAIQGMHCTSCAMNIDGELEDVDGVYEASTSYAKSTTTVLFDPKKLSSTDLLDVIKKAGYQASVSK